ncbi:Uma2 family endonuclease [Rhodopirellula sp. JC639]|uniref:Uma2 family endonuclease n=1 Tax=Stieleria mannarensis TaxID=2755585 RepID=UPI0015FED2A5|nr:Uma2 family endonuclease [Rhodopirellula sp. JC639]
MSSAPRYRPAYTVEDYARWEGEWELWEGLPVSMSPSPFGRHSQLLVRIATQLELAVELSGCHAAVLAEIDWIISNETVVRPDVSVVCGDVPVRHVEKPPALVVEVLSDATRSRDVGEKKGLYRDEGVRWYLVIDPEANSLSAWSLDADGSYLSVPATESLAVDICSDCRLSLDVKRMLR